MRKLFGLCLVLFALTAPPNLGAQSNQQRSYTQFKNDFAIGLRNKSNAYARLSAYGLSPEKTALLVEHNLSLANDDDFVMRLFDELRATGVIDRVIDRKTVEKKDIDAVTSLSFELFESFASKGIKRLDYRDVRAYLESLGTMIGMMPPSLCKAAIVGDISGQRQETAMSVYFYKKMSVDEMEAFLRLIKKATLAEIKNFPPVRQVSDSQRKIASDAYQDIFLTDLGRHPDGVRLVTAASNLQRASAEDACEYVRLALGALLKMDGTVAEWQARVFLQSF